MPPTTARVPLRLPKQDLSEPARVMLQDVQDDLARELGNAATTGLLTPKRQDTPAIAAPLKTPAPPEPKEPPTHRMLPESPLVNLRVTSSRDRLLNANGTQENFSADGVACPDPAVFDVANWGDARPFHIQIAEARHGLFTEADRLDGKVALNLARKFLYFGFGAEARQVLALDPSLAADHVFLLDMADLFDARTANSATRLSTFAGCDSAVSLWAILSLPDGASPLIPSVDPALRTLNSLPVHLRIVLAPMLSRKLQDLGQSDAAAAALRSLKRLPEGLPPAGQLVRAKSAIESGDTSAGTAALKEVAEGNSVSSPEALVALVDAQLAANRPISREIASLIAAYAKEFRNTPQGAELRRAHVIALLKSGQFDAAFDAARILGADADTQSANALRRSMLRELTTYASDIDFLHHIFARADTDIAALEEADIARLAGRFLDLGFPQRAERALATLSWGKTADETRLIAARVSLAMEKPFKAQADLLGVDGDTSDRLRAEAKRMAGAHDDAHRLFASMNDAGLAEESAWLAEGWRDLLPRDAPIFGPVSALSVPEPTSEEAPVGMLARSAALLQESAEARQTLDDLLAADRLRINADE